MILHLIIKVIVLYYGVACELDAFPAVVSVTFYEKSKDRKWKGYITCTPPPPPPPSPSQTPSLQILFNPLSPFLHIQILQTDLHTFPLRISWENLIKHQGIFSFVIILYILTTLSLDNVWILLGENCCWSLLGLKGLNEPSLTMQRGKRIISGIQAQHRYSYCMQWFGVKSRSTVVFLIVTITKCWRCKSVIKLAYGPWLQI